MTNKEILTAWLKYIHVEDLEAVTIDQKEIEQKNRVTLKISSYNGNYFPECIVNDALFDEIIASDNDKGKDEFYWFFPLILRYKDGKNFLQPLFAISINQCIDFKSKSITPEKAFEASNNVIPIQPVLQILGIETEEIPTNLNFIDLIAHIVNKDSFSDLSSAFDELKNVMQNGFNAQQLASFDGIVIRLKPNNFSKKLKADHKFLIENGIEADSLLSKYLQNKSTYSLQPLRDLKRDLFWFGAYDQHPLGKGQAVVMQHYVSSDKLIAVQGGPGTGKTTLILSLIANTIVRRAYHLTKHGTDFNNLMHIVSTSNKAVENVAERFLKDPLFIDRNDFYLILGNKDNKAQAIERINKYLDELKNTMYDINVANETKEHFLSHYSQLELKANQLFEEQQETEQLQKKLSTLSDQLTSKETEKQNHEQSLENTRSLFNDFPIKMGYKSWKDIETIFENIEKKAQSKITPAFIDGIEKHIRLQGERTTSYHEQINLFRTNYKLNTNKNTDILTLAQNKIFESKEVLLNKIDNMSFLDNIFDLFLKKKKNLFNMFNKEHEELLYLFGLDTLNKSNIYDIIGSLKAIEEKLKTIKESKPLDEKYLDENWVIHHDSEKKVILYIKTIYEHKTQKSKFEQNIQDLESKINLNAQAIRSIKVQQQVIEKKLEQMITDAVDAYRLQYQKENDQLFQLSMKVMKYEVLKNKDKIIEVLEDFKLQLSEWNKDIFNRWKDNISEFARYVSMAYPVVTSTMASSASIFNFYPNNIFNKRPPVYMVLSDESGMSTPHLILSAFFRAEKAIVVGDPKQLPPIVPLTESTIKTYENEAFGDDHDSSQRYSPVSISAYHRAAGCKSGHYDDIGNGILLDEHRRCQKDIADLFIKVAAYNGLKIKTPSIDSKDAHLRKKFESFGNKQLYFVPVNGQKGAAKNTNIDEVEYIKKLIDELERCGYNSNEEIGLITPYANQSKLLMQYFAKRLRHSDKEKKIGTVHAFQGAEYEVMIFSPVIHTAEDSSSFINKSPNLLNVAISRAKQIFIMVGNTDKIKSSGGYLQTIYTSSTIK